MSLEKRFIGLQLDVECHKHGLSRRHGLMSVNVFTEDKKQTILWRVELIDKLEYFDTICNYHEKYFGKVRETT